MIFCEKRGKDVEGCISIKFCDSKKCKLKPKKKRKVKHEHKNKKAKNERA